MFAGYNGGSRDVVIKAVGDELLEALKDVYSLKNDLQALVVARMVGATCLRIENETGATFEKNWHFEQFYSVNYATNLIHLGKFDMTANNITVRASVTTCSFTVGD